MIVLKRGLAKLNHNAVTATAFLRSSINVNTAAVTAFAPCEICNSGHGNPADGNEVLAAGQWIAYGAV
jgi:hypothetical protein